MQAPHCILNTRISRNRRFATQQYPLDRLKAIGAQYDATINDVALAIIGGGLRRFLDELGELPNKSLIVVLPVNVRPKDDEGGGNAVATILRRWVPTLPIRCSGWRRSRRQPARPRLS